MSARLRVGELRAELERRGLDASGTKPALVRRLDAAVRKEEKNAAAVAAKVSDGGGADGVTMDGEANVENKRKRRRTGDGEVEGNGHVSVDPAKLEEMGYRELQVLAKARGVAANGSKKDVIKRLLSAPSDAVAVADGGVHDGSKTGKGSDGEVEEEAKKEKMVTATKKGAAVLDQRIPDHLKMTCHVLQVDDLEGVGRTDDSEGAGQENDSEGARQENDSDGVGQDGGFADDEGVGGDTSAKGSASSRRFRRSHLVAPPLVPQGGNKIEITPCGDGSWIDSMFDGTTKHRQVNQVLGNLCRLHYPGVVTLPSGERQLATTWDHYQYALDGEYGTAQGAVSHDFWLRFQLPETGNYQDHALAVFNHNAHKVVKDAIYYARIQANNQYYKEILGQPMSKALGSSAIYLTEEQYRSVRIPWFKNRDADYFEFCKLWSSSAFKLVSEKKRLCRGTDPKHTYGGDGHIRKAKRMEARTGVVPSDIKVYVAGHKGPDPSNPDQLCSQSATERLMQYGQEMVNRHGKEYDWQKEPIDPMAVYTSGGGKSHGRYSMLNGIIDSRQVRAQKSTQSSQSLGVSSVRRRSEEELEVMRLKEAMRQRDEYYAACLAQHQALLQQLARQQGLDMSQFQPPPLPPPLGSPPAAQVFHTLGQDGGSSSSPNDLHTTTPRGSAQNSNQPSEGN